MVAHVVDRTTKVLLEGTHSRVGVTPLQCPGNPDVVFVHDVSAVDLPGVQPQVRVDAVP